MTSQILNSNENTFRWFVNRRWIMEQDTRKESQHFELKNLSLLFSLVLKSSEEADEKNEGIGKAGKATKTAKQTKPLRALWIHLKKNSPFIFGTFKFNICNSILIDHAFDNKPSGNYFVSAYHPDLFRTIEFDHVFSIEVTWKEDVKKSSLEYMYSTLSNGLSWLLESEELSDMMIVTEDGCRFPVHKSILSARSPVFYAMFKTDSYVVKRNFIEVSKLTSFTVKNLIAYMYCCGLPELTYDGASELLEAANKYDMQDLKEVCIRRLLQHLNASNALDLLLKMDVYHEDDTKTVVLRYISDHLDQFASRKAFDCLKGSPDLLIEILCTVARSRI